MVQFFQGREDPRSAQLSQLGQTLGQGIGGGLNAYFSNKALDAAAKSPEFKDMPLSEKFASLQRAAAPYGPKAQQAVNQRMQYIEQESQRGLLQTALGKVKDVVKTGASPTEAILAGMEAMAGIPGSERYAAQILPMLGQYAAANSIYGQQGQQQGQPVSNVTRDQQASSAQGQGLPQQQGLAPQGQEVPFQQPSGANYGIKTPEDMDAEARRAVQVTGNPDAYNTVMNQQLTTNAELEKRKADLQQTALASGSISAEDLPFFMSIGDTNDPNALKDPQAWFINTMNKWAPVRNDIKKLNDAFIPGLGSALLGRNREKSLKGLEPIVQDMKRKGLERQAREFLNNNYLSHTEVEELINPISEKTNSALEKIPKGIFSHEGNEPEIVPGISIQPGRKKGAFVDYETALEKSPKTIQTMQKRLSDFFLKNVDQNTSLLALRHKLWKDKDYDWRQIGPAIEEAKTRGLKLSPNQESELADLSTNPPIESLPDIFMDWDRIVKYFRGNK